MTINAISSSVGSGGAVSKATQQAGGMGKDDFLKLLVGQLRGQNPMNPMGDQEFLAQMAQFSTLEQVTNMAGGTQALNEALATSQSVALIGHDVSYLKADGTTATGTVEKVVFADGKISLTISGVEGIEPGMVAEVR